MDKPDLYVNSATLAAELGVTRAAVANWLDRHDDCPQPDAYLVDPRGIGGMTPLWLDSRVEQWQEWQVSRRARPVPKGSALARARQTMADEASAPGA